MKNFKQFKLYRINEFKFYDDDVIKFKQEIECPSEFDDGTEEGYKVYIVPDKKYIIRNIKQKGYSGWVTISGYFKHSKTKEVEKRSITFSPYDLKDISKHII